MRFDMFIFPCSLIKLRKPSIRRTMNIVDTGMLAGRWKCHCLGKLHQLLDIMEFLLFQIKEALENIIPNVSKMSWEFYTIKSVGRVMSACWVLHSKLTYVWRNMNISSIFYFSKSTLINKQYSSIWDTLKMIQFTKYLIKWRRTGRISRKFWYWSYLKSSMEFDIKI